MNRVIDTLGQFQKLFPSYSRNTLPPDLMLPLVNDAVDATKRLGERGHWAYDLNRHQALIELRDALKREMAHAD